jgi:hypothetical protein
VCVCVFVELGEVREGRRRRKIFTVAACGRRGLLVLAVCVKAARCERLRVGSWPRHSCSQLVTVHGAVAHWNSSTWSPGRGYTSFPLAFHCFVCSPVSFCCLCLLWIVHIEIDTFRINQRLSEPQYPKNKAFIPWHIQTSRHISFSSRHSSVESQDGILRQYRSSDIQARH